MVLPLLKYALKRLVALPALVKELVMLPRSKVDKRDLQGNVLTAYGNDFRFGLYLFVCITDAREGRRWLRELCPRVTSGESWRRGHKPLETLNLAFTCRGLQALGVPPQSLDTFPEEFLEGMDNRAELLGDHGESAPPLWEPGLQQPHVLVTVMAQDKNVRRRRERLLVDRIKATEGLSVAHVERAALLRHPDDDRLYEREHFGFADGFSQPSIRGNSGPYRRKGMGTPHVFWWRSIAPGEFVLGYRGDDGDPPTAPVGPFGHSSSFAVVRKLYQNVPLFRRYLREQVIGGLPFLPSTPLPTDPLDRDKELARRERLLAAKLVGRWHDGRSLVVSDSPTGPERDRGLKVINSFRYRQDKHGYGCPLGAHVRRANPRDGLDPRDPLGYRGKLAKRHRIIRRAMPYGPAAFLPGRQDYEPQGLFDVDVADADRGLMFICYQASIARQFEIVQGRWLNDGDAFWLGGDRDFLTISPKPESVGEGKMGVQGPRPSFVRPQPAFVTTRGGGYFLTPGRTALRALAGGYWL